MEHQATRRSDGALKYARVLVRLRHVILHIRETCETPRPITAYLVNAFRH